MSATFTDFREKARLYFSTEPGDDVSEQQPDRLDEIAQYCPQLTFQQVRATFYDFMLICAVFSFILVLHAFAETDWICVQF